MREARRNGKRVLDIMREFKVSERTAHTVVKGIIPGGLKDYRRSDYSKINDLVDKGFSNAQIMKIMQVSDSTIWYAKNARKKQKEREHETA
jgi:hypothetical protein